MSERTESLVDQLETSLGTPDSSILSEPENGECIQLSSKNRVNHND
jgi:hypothetical protein